MGWRRALAGDAVGIVLDFLPGALGGDFAAETAGAGAEVDDEVAAAHGVLVVLDDEEGVAFVAEGDEGVEELGVVARVEADGGFVEDVEDAAEVGAELGGEADALGFAA